MGGVYTRWKEVIYAHSHADFMELWSKLQDDYNGEITGYLNETWIRPWVRRFVKCYTDRHCHLGNTATSRSEGSHGRLKQLLLFATGDLPAVAAALGQLFRRERLKWAEDINAAKTRPRISHRAPFLRDVLAEIPPYALEQVLTQYKKIGDDMPRCTDTYTKHLGLPCSHHIKTRLATPPGLLTIDDFHPQWYCHKSAHYQRRFDSSDDEEEDDIDPNLRVQEPLVGKERGRPRGSTTEPSGKRVRRQQEFDRSSRREPSQFERVEARLQARPPPTPPLPRGGTPRGGGASRARGSPAAPRWRGGTTATMGALNLPITASQVARKEEQAEIDASAEAQATAEQWARGQAGREGSTDTPMRGGLLSLPPRRRGGGGGGRGRGIGGGVEHEALF